MPILVTVSVSMADVVMLRELGRFVETAGRNGADPDADLREYDENNELVGLVAVGELESGEAGEDNPAGENVDEDVDEDVEEDEGDVDEDDGDNEDEVVDDESDEGQQVEQDEGAAAATDESYRGS